MNTHPMTTRSSTKKGQQVIDDNNALLPLPYALALSSTVCTLVKAVEHEHTADVVRTVLHQRSFNEGVDEEDRKYSVDAYSNELDLPEADDGGIDFDEIYMAIPLLRGLGLHVVVLSYHNEDCPFVVYWEAATAAGGMEDNKARFPHMVHYPPTAPLLLFCGL
jgi:hypothetical protein